MLHTGFFDEELFHKELVSYGVCLTRSSSRGIDFFSDTTRYDVDADPPSRQGKVWGPACHQPRVFSIS